MGQQDVKGLDDARLRQFIRALIQDVHALERMLNDGWIEADVRRIGAEQELFLVDSSLEPALTATEILEDLKDEQFTTELARFNLEVNLLPRHLGGDCLSQIEKELEEKIDKARATAARHDTRVLMTGILPTIELGHLGLDAMTPNPRYAALNKAMSDLRGGHFETYIKGLDELQASHDNVMLESCNTSFQVHFQVGAAEFASLYNLAQVVTAPVLAAAANSPVMLKHRLWHETRVALFQQSVDSRSRTHTARGQRTRVSFGDDWVNDSVLEIFREDIARFRVLLASDPEESPLEMLARGVAPPLTAMRLHNGTVYRWNRACYGVHEGKAHLRIENRVLPAGPSILDEVANAAFYFGLMTSVGEEFGDVTRHMSFENAKENFIQAARYGLKAQVHWLDGTHGSTEDLILKNLLPMARAGLKQQGIDETDIARYLNVIEERVTSRRTGAQWALDSLESMKSETSKDKQYRALTAAMLSNQRTGVPIHRWELAAGEGGPADWRDSFRTVRQVMTTDLFTVRPEDSVDLTASLMEWEHIRHVPVEDDAGQLVGVVSHRALLRLLCRGVTHDSEPVAVREIMKGTPITVHPDADIVEAIALMTENAVSCLPVVEDERLVGIVTEADFMEPARRALLQILKR